MLGRPQIRVTLSGFNVIALVDTGASICVMQLNTFQKLASSLHRSIIMREAAPLQSVTGDSLDVVGSTQITLDGFDEPVIVTVVRGLREELILGCDVLNNSQIDLKRGVITMHGKCWPILRTSRYNRQVNIIVPVSGSSVFNRLIRDNADLFAIQGQSPGRCVYQPMNIETTGPPLCQHAYRAPLTKRQLISDCVNDMLAQGIIRPSVSSWASPVTLVPKSDGTPRFCIDYRKLNAVTTPDCYPLPLIADVCDLIGLSKIFSTLDLKAGYWQIEMDELAIPKTAFRCHRGLFEFLRLPFGLRNGPAAFQRIMDTVLQDLIGKVCMVYLDDIVIYSENQEEHIRHVQLVFERLRTAGLRLNAAKCHFGLKEIKLLGFIINANGIATDPAKVEVIKNLPSPTTVKQIRSFLGTASFYRQFVKNFSAVAEPLSKLTRKNVKFQWGPEQEAAFLELKELLVSSKVMAAPRPNDPYILYTDASEYAVGAILVQEDDTGVERIIQYVSHALSASQKRYSTVEKEAFAIVFAINKLRPYLYGARFVIYTDHQPLRGFFTKPMNNSRIQRWAILLAEFHAEIRYLPGKRNCRADMVSRIPPLKSVAIIDAHNDFVDPDAFPEQKWAETLPLEHDGLDMNVIRQQQQLEFCKELKLATQADSDYMLMDGVLYSTKRPHVHAADYPRLLLPTQFRDSVIDRAHREVGHLNNATLTRLCEAYVWSGMRRIVRARIAKCPLCCVHSRKTDLVEMGTMDLANYPGQIIGMDLQGPYVPSAAGSNKYILLIIDHCTLWIEAYPLPDKTNKSVWTAFANYYLPRFGSPEVIISDNGLEFCANDWEDYLLGLGISHRRTTPQHPQSNGKTERANKTVKNMLAVAVNNQVNMWEDRLGDVLMAYRISVSSVTGYSPYYLLYGRRPRVPLSNTLFVPNGDLFANRLDFLAQALQTARVNTEHSRIANRERLKRRANAGDIHKGDHVIVLAPERLTLTSRFDPLWIVTRIRGTTLWLHQQQTGKIRKVHREKVRLADPELAWDQVNPRPIRQQAARKRYLSRRVANNDTPVVIESPGTDSKTKGTKACPAGGVSNHSAPLLRAPPLRLHRVTCYPEQEGQLRSSARLAYKRHALAPSPIEQKRARWEVISLVSAFSSPWW